MMNKQPKIKRKEIALVGNPNSGKTTIFNALTGLRHKTANYPGVTVEKKEGILALPLSREQVTVIDLPGAYSLTPTSTDEEIVHEVLLGRVVGTPPPDLVVIIVDASNLERNLFFAGQVIETSTRAIMVLNMWDLALKNGLDIDLQQLSRRYGIPVVPAIGGQKGGMERLKVAIEKQLSLEPAKAKVSPENCHLPLPLEVKDMRGRIERFIKFMFKHNPHAAQGEALRLIGDSYFRSPLFREMGEQLKQVVIAVRKRLEHVRIDWSSVEAENRYEFIKAIYDQAVPTSEVKRVKTSDRIDRILTHPFWGLIFFGLMMAAIFQAIFSWANYPMEMISTCITKMSEWFGQILPDGQLKSLAIDGIMAGVGGIVIFLPQILFLFFFIALFEDSGYMARAAFLLDRIMRSVGLSGKSFIPLLSSFACAVPGIMATRTVEDKNDRLATILVVPLMSCSARLPVYTLMIAAFIPPAKILGIFDLKGVTLFSLYVLSVVAGLIAAWIFRKTILRKSLTPFILELPPYRIPQWRTVLHLMWDRAKVFLSRAGTIIFAFSIILWFLISYPRNPAVEQRFDSARVAASQTLQGDELAHRLSYIDAEQKGEEIRISFAGWIGRSIEPVIKPLGFTWEIGIGLVASFVARELMVSTLAILNHVEDKSGGESRELVQALQEQVSISSGKRVYTPLVAVSLMVFFLFACQCISTLAIVKRETNGWRSPLFMVAYMTTLAWVASFLVYQGGKILGFE